jgi:hypothetical protein
MLTSSLVLGLRQHIVCYAGAVRQHTDGHQLLGVAAEEELAECQVPVHQELHGKASAALLGAPDQHCGGGSRGQVESGSC